jgi:hypothetical protein
MSEQLPDGAGKADEYTEATAETAGEKAPTGAGGAGAQHHRPVGVAGGGEPPASSGGSLTDYYNTWTSEKLGRSAQRFGLFVAGNVLAPWVASMAFPRSGTGGAANRRSDRSYFTWTDVGRYGLPLSVSATAAWYSTRYPTQDPAAVEQSEEF